MGAQSFDRGVLEALERLHSPDSVRRAFVAARAAGYENVNLDLIYGADGEGLDSWERTLEQAIDLAPEHISAYALTIEPATALGRKVQTGVVPAPDPDLQADMFSAACDLLRDAGYHHYEVSNWAKPGFECRHNLGYWERRGYIGLGAGAHSFRDDRRWWNVRPPEEYMARVEAGELPLGGDERLEPSDAYLEEVFLRLRILQGIPSSWVDAAVALPFLESGLLQEDDGSLVPTERGMLLLNELVLALAGELVRPDDGSHPSTGSAGRDVERCSLPPKGIRSVGASRSSVETTCNLPSGPSVKIVSWIFHTASGLSNETDAAEVLNEEDAALRCGAGEAMRSLPHLLPHAAVRVGQGRSHVRDLPALRSRRVPVRLHRSRGSPASPNTPSAGTVPPCCTHEQFADPRRRSDLDRMKTRHSSSHPIGP